MREAVLSQAGFLHQYPAVGLDGAKESKDLTPALSIFLPDFVLGPALGDEKRGHTFNLYGARGSASGKDSKQGIAGSLGFGKATEGIQKYNLTEVKSYAVYCPVGYTFRAKDRSTLLDWHDAIRKSVKNTSTVAPPVGYVLLNIFLSSVGDNTPVTSPISPRSLSAASFRSEEGLQSPHAEDLQEDEAIAGPLSPTTASTLR